MSPSTLSTVTRRFKACGDHLDVESVVLKAQKEKKAARKEAAPAPRPQRPASAGDAAKRLRTLEQLREELTSRVEVAEARVSDIDALFCRPGYFDETAAEEVSARQRERTDLSAEVSRLLGEWESLEDEIGELSA